MSWEIIYLTLESCTKKLSAKGRSDDIYSSIILEL